MAWGTPEITELYLYFNKTTCHGEASRPANDGRENHVLGAAGSIISPESDGTYALEDGQELFPVNEFTFFCWFRGASEQ
jgi:hypothetical protein